MILTVHVLLMLVLDEGVAPGFGVLRRHHHPNALYCSVLLKLALQLTFAEKDNILKFTEFTEDPHTVLTDIMKNV